MNDVIERVSGISSDNSDQRVSFRGNPIPQVRPKSNYSVANSQEVINKISSMNGEERRSVTLEGVHHGDRGITDVKLSTGDVVPIETAIALAENHMLSGYTAGSTFRGGRILRSKPDQAGSSVRIHDLPEF